MKRLQAFKYELMPNGKQRRDMRRFAGSCRVVFNEALAWQKSRHDKGEKKLGYVGLCKRLTDWRNGLPGYVADICNLNTCKRLTDWRNGLPLPSGRVAPWLREAPTHPLQQTLKDLERAYKNCFEKRADFPRFKKKGMKACGEMAQSGRSMKQEPAEAIQSGSMPG